MSTDLPIDLRLSEEQRISREGMRRFASQTMAVSARKKTNDVASDNKNFDFNVFIYSSTKS